ncbi:MAG: addiction module protein [Pyrinomonadaceae bacterium]
MGVLIENITEAALSLPVTERAILADRLVDSLDSSSEAQDIRQAWASEAQRRLDEIESGVENAIDADEVFAEIGESNQR